MNGRANTLYWVGDAYYQLNDLVSAEKIYKEFILRAPQSPLVPYALEALGSTLSAQGPARDGEAIIALNQSELRSRDLNNRELAERSKSNWRRSITTSAISRGRRDLESSGLDLHANRARGGDVSRGRWRAGISIRKPSAAGRLSCKPIAPAHGCLKR